MHENTIQALKKRKTCHLQHHEKDWERLREERPASTERQSHYFSFVSEIYWGKKKPNLQSQKVEYADLRWEEWGAEIYLRMW